MPLPLEGQYSSRQTLYKAIQAWARPRGYAFTTGKSRHMEGSGRWRVQYACDRFYQPPKYTTRVRQTSSRGISCLFSVLAVESQDKLTWELKHRSKYKFCTHNHDPSPSPAAHPSHRHMPSSIQALNQGLQHIGVYPRQALTTIR